MVLLRSFTQVFLVASCLCCLVYLGFFDQVIVELGLEHYAEDSRLVKLLPALRAWLKMPLNACVSVGYTLLGIYWLVATDSMLDQGDLVYTDAYLMGIFNWIVVFYGPIQCIRIITQLQPFAVLDQWCILLLYAWVTIWSRHCSTDKPSLTVVVVSMFLSISSYCLTLALRYGFQIILGVHIVVSVFAVISLYWKHPAAGQRQCLLKALLCGTGCVLFKLLDLRLNMIHFIFSCVSGHFLSQILALLQIYYTNNFFISFMTLKYKRGQIRKNTKTE